MNRFIPETPGGTMLFNLEASTKDDAIKKLLKDARHMPYKTWENFEARGYRIVELTDDENNT